MWGQQLAIAEESFLSRASQGIELIKPNHVWSSQYGTPISFLALTFPTPVRVSWHKYSLGCTRSLYVPSLIMPPLFGIPYSHNLHNSSTSHISLTAFYHPPPHIHHSHHVQILSWLNLMPLIIKSPPASPWFQLSSFHLVIYRRHIGIDS